jgi:hypothetical protein
MKTNNIYFDKILKPLKAEKRKAAPKELWTKIEGTLAEPSKKTFSFPNILQLHGPLQPSFAAALALVVITVSGLYVNQQLRHNAIDSILNTYLTNTEFYETDYEDSYLNI